MLGLVFDFVINLDLRCFKFSDPTPPLFSASPFIKFQNQFYFLCIFKNFGVNSSVFFRLAIEFEFMVCNFLYF